MALTAAPAEVARAPWPAPRPETARPTRADGSRWLPHLPGLDGVRALAVTTVLLYHAGVGWLPGGFLGVEVFFVVSGYLITSLLVSERRRRGRVSLRGFWVRRARRLLPALLTMIAAVMVVWVLFVRERLAELRADVLASLFYVENWHLIASGQSYFDTFFRPSPLQHVWSLAVEEQFYVLWPLIVVLLAAATRNRRRPMAVTMLVGALASYVLMQVLYTPGADPSRVYYGTDTRASALLLGGALALLWRPDRSRGALAPPRRQVSLELVGLVGIVGLGVLTATTHGSSSFLYRAGFLLCSLGTLAVVAAAARPTWVGRVLGLRPLQWVGQRSYGLYLWHWPVFVLTRPGIDLEWRWSMVLALRLGVTSILAGLSYRFVEKPARHGGISAWLRSLRPATRPAHQRRLATSFSMVAAAVVIIPSGIVLARAQPKTDPVRAAIAEGQAALENQATLTTSSVATTVPHTAARRPTRPTTTEPSFASTGTTVTTVATTTAPATVPTTVPATPPPTAPPPPPPTAPPTLPPGPIIMIGDSVMLGAAGALQAHLGPAAYIDAQVSRAFMRGVEVAQVLRAQGVLGPVVVVHLGDNGRIGAGQVASMMDALAGVPRVVFLTVKVPRGWEESVNLTLVEEVPKYPNARLVDWYGFSVGHPEWFYSDGIHLNPVGREAYAQLIAANLA